MKQPTSYIVTNHDADGMCVEESLRTYLTRLTGAAACLNFTMRTNGTPIVVGRSFDAIATGRLLVQERTPDMAYYFMKDAHYYEFSTIEELDGIVSAMPSSGAWRAVAEQGQAYFNETYSDAAVLRHLATFL